MSDNLDSLDSSAYAGNFEDDVSDFNNNDLQEAFVSRAKTSLSRSRSYEVLTDIYKEQCNIAVWQRHQPKAFTQAICADIKLSPLKNTNIQVRIDNIGDDIAEIASDREYGEQLRAYISQTVEMFCVLFDCKKVGLRLSTLNKAMCPRFHVDRVPCRLITTFAGAGTEWIAHENVNRSKLGHGSGGKKDNASGLYSHASVIQQLQCGDVALLKGETWDGNEGAGLVHRSPAIDADAPRLLLTIDFVA